MTLCIQTMIPHKGGLPHSDTQGSTPARGFPWIFAACHVLHRLLAPRHPPDALLLLIPRPRPCRHGHVPKTPPCTEAIHRPKHTRQQTHSRPTAKPSLSTHSNVLNAAARFNLEAKNRLRSPKPQVRHPGQTRYGPPPPAPPSRSRDPAKPTEASCASKTHQNLIHNPQRTHALQAPNAKPRPRQ